MDYWFVFALMAVSFVAGFTLAWVLARKKNKKQTLTPMLGVVFPKEK